MNSQWFRRFAEAGPGAVRLVCFPHAGGSASVYVPLARRLSAGAGGPGAVGVPGGPGVDVLAVQYPGRQDRRNEAGPAGIVELAGRIAGELGAAPGGPYAFFGHSMGALLAYESARALAAAGAPLPVRLFLSARGAPGPFPDRHDVLAGDREILAAVRSLGGTGAAVLADPELVEMALPALRADYRALASYRWGGGAPLEIAVSVLAGREDPVVAVEEAARWREFTRAGFELEVFPGGHFFLDQNLDAVAGLVLRGVRDAVTQGGR
ncbi:alpha/beta fold hydrolase [Streptomyces sp. NBC_01317]|uniref:thioesterase II family protein n=1 Tax=Streptomyces sp. NBC_01317 TaxID=2903822 RepID=UPI002E167248|nr:alpha/beta fold hydrolase [Streptomyces sp. NBC_01317]WSJ47683.1 alpha/beta fold hydrolase [Streptomyces sp. NBC_01317]